MACKVFRETKLAYLDASTIFTFSSPPKAAATTSESNDRISPVLRGKSARVLRKISVLEFYHPGKTEMYTTMKTDEEAEMWGISTQARDSSMPTDERDTTPRRPIAAFLDSSISFSSSKLTVRSVPSQTENSNENDNDGKMGHKIV
jgi:hypothetical protein